MRYFYHISPGKTILKKSFLIFDYKLNIVYDI